MKWASEASRAVAQPMRIRPNMLNTLANRLRLQNNVLIIALFLVAVILIALGSTLRSTSKQIEFSISLATSTSGAGQVFIDTPSGYAEAASVAFPIESGTQFHQYRARIKGNPFPGKIRFDPGTGRGDIYIQSIRVEAGRTSKRLSGSELLSAIRPLNQLTIERDYQTGVHMRSTGDDPFFEFAMPAPVAAASGRARSIGLLLMLAGAIGVCALLFAGFEHMFLVLRRIFTRGGFALFAVALITTLVLLAIQHVGCSSSPFCSPRGMQYGAGLMMAALGAAVIGAAVLRLLGVVRKGAGASRLFTCITVGQATLLLYVYVRSVISAAIPNAPLGAAEMFAVLGAATVYLGRSGEFSAFSSNRGRTWITLELALLAAICMVVADRELPRVLMLSSDPDTHGYFARKVELLGAIPWHGEDVFGYPAGSAALTFVWAKLSFLDVRNALTALPLLQAFFAALMIGEAFAVRTRSPQARLLILATVLSITAAGFLLPLFKNYSHMEGAGRQIAIAFMALPWALIVSAPKQYGRKDAGIFITGVLSLFSLAALNPVNVIASCVLISGYACYIAATQRRISWLLLAIVVVPLLLLLDPYYFSLIFGSGQPAEKIGVNPALHIKNAGEVFSDWSRYYLGQPTRVLQYFWSLAPPGRKIPLFAIFAIVLVCLRSAITKQWRIGWQLGGMLLVILLGLSLADGLFSALGDDRRFYLLLPYFSLNVAQHKFLLLTVLAGAVISAAIVKRHPPWLLLGLAIAINLMINMGVRREQSLVLNPRVDYCGSLGCTTDSDIRVIKRFEAMTRSERSKGNMLDGRVLVPNSVHDTPNEFWVFPVAGARALPFFDVLPVAFYYYQGDDDYTSGNYMKHVCSTFDRTWLKSQGITYLFLPADRSTACVDSLESLPVSEEIIFRDDNTYLLRLR